METFYYSLVSLLIGVVARIFIPWLAKRQMNPAEAQWDWAYVWPQLLAVLMVLMLLPLVIDDISSLGQNTPQVAWLMGWGAADLGREIYKALVDESST